jgi:hypothetical protein
MAGATRGVIRGKIVGRKTNLGPFSPYFGDQVPVRPSGPNGVTIVATGHTESIVVTWTAPTTHADGTLLKTGELAYYYVYYHTASGIDITMPASYTAREKIKAERYEFTIPDPAVTMGPYYFVVTAVDTEGNQSVASNEDSATANSQSPGPALLADWTDNVDDLLVGKTRIFLKFQLPKSTWYSFSHYKVYYDVNSGGGFSGSWAYLSSERVGFMHSGLTETSYYKYKVSVVGEDGTETTGTISDSGGAGYRPNNTDQSNILADIIAAQHIIASYDITSRTFYGGIFQSQNFSAGAGAKFDAENSRLTLGGSAAPKFYFDGTNLSLSGAITATSGTIGGFTIGASALTAGLGGTAVGMAPGSYPFYAGDVIAASAPFRVSSAGVLNATGATISGALTASSLTISGTGGILPTLMDNLSTGRNMLANPGFEQGSTGWQTGTGRSFEISGGDNSNYFLKVTRAGADVYSYQYTPNGDIRYFEVSPGEVYEYGCSAKSSNGTCRAYIGIVSTDKDLGGGSSDAIFSTSLTWETKSSTFTIPATNKFLRLYVGAYTVNGDASFDNVYLRRVDYTVGVLGGTNVVTISSAGLNVGASGRILGGQTAYDTGTGFFMGYSGAAYKSSIGNSAGNKMTWDGTTLTIAGTINAGAGYFGSGSTRVAIEAAGLNIGNTGSIRGGQTAYNTGTGFFLGYSGAAYKLSIGNPAGNRMTWDGSSLAISGTITCGAGSSYSGLGTLSTLNSVAASNCDTTIISGGKIITGLLTASNIQTGTLNASLVTVSNLNAGSITTGTLSANYISAGTLNCGLFTVTNLSAASITTGTLTGRDIRTASSGERAGVDATSSMTGTAHRVYAHDGTRARMLFGAGGGSWYDSSGTQTIVFDSSSATAPLFLRQQVSSSGMEVLRLQQDDTSEGFINFVGADGGAVTTAGAHSARVELNGVKYRIMLWDNA